jgi:mannose-1-phosphate guanylyltransferase/mannose-6-phosphate isomerase
MDRPNTTHVEKPWGHFHQYALNAKCTVKILACSPGQKLSLQRHSKRDELWVALDGRAFVELNGETIFPSEGQEIWLPCGCTHRLGCKESADGQARILEVSFGDFDEGDIERLEDDYGRK